ncbi:hypothetical protein [Janibacter alittae]|uniref:WXG100 family type VII secretion target n=1 Tax=Janibacter alittae TaxID=3115209 RepID=A0ABZ2MKN6_9MICO
MALQFFRTELGDPDRIRAEARRLAARAAALREAAARLHEVSTKGVWESPSGVAFAEQVGEVPQTLQHLATTLEESAQVIAPYADLLAESQRVMTRERAAYDHHVEESNRLAAQRAGMSPEDPDYARVDRQWRDAADQREFAKRRYQSEGEQATLDEETMARRLDDLASSSTDPWGYDLFEGLSALGRSGAVDNLAIDVVPVLRPIGLLQFADPIGTLGLRALYDQGSYSGAGKAAWQALRNVVKVPVGAGATADQAVRRTRRASETAAAKARHGNPVRASGSAPKRLRHKAGARAKQTTAGARVRAAHAARDAFDDATGIRLITNMTSDWAAIAGAGHVTTGVHVLKYSVASADKVDSTIRTARTTGQTIRNRRKPPGGGGRADD